MPTEDELVMGKDDALGKWSRMCNGRSPWYWNIIVCPFVMLYRSFEIYCFGCLLEYAIRLANVIGCSIFKIFCWWCCEYTDKEFTATAKSIGPWQEKTEAQIEAEIEWQRATEVVDRLGPPPGRDKHGKPLQTRVKLFEGGVDVGDIAQGGVGDCWLMSALCCMAERPGQLYKIFHQNAYSDRGKYSCSLYDGREGRWVTITVDDLLPVNKASGRLLFAQPKGRELWVLLLEKAFAKFCGSYEGLNGGNEVWAFQALTGDPVFNLIREKDAKWTRYDLAHRNDPKKKRAIGLRKTEEKYSDQQCFELIRTYVKAEALMTASISNKGEERRTTGLVAGHAYSLLDAKSFSGGINLVRLRNPWGTFEWKGPWSDHSKEWKENPKIKKFIKPSDMDDGTFWMHWDDFSKHFNGLDICNRSRGVRDLYLDLYEEDSCPRHNIGPAKGCFFGCLKFWLCFAGCKALYCGKIADKKTAKPREGKDDDFLDHITVGVSNMGISNMA